MRFQFDNLESTGTHKSDSVSYLETQALSASRCPANQATCQIIESLVLNECIVLTTRDNFRTMQKKFADKVVYTDAEVNELNKINKDRDAIRQIHDIKKIFNGEVVSVE